MLDALRAVFVCPRLNCGHQLWIHWGGLHYWWFAFCSSALLGFLFPFLFSDSEAIYTFLALTFVGELTYDTFSFFGNGKWVQCFRLFYLSWLVSYLERFSNYVHLGFKDFLLNLCFQNGTFRWLELLITSYFRGIGFTSNHLMLS